MKHRVGACFAVAVLGVVLACGGVGITSTGAAQPKPTVQLSSTVLVPGQTLVITGTHWPDFSSVDAVVCGANAVSGSADCAVTETATMTATHRGELWTRFGVVLPPKPCPCVVLFTSATGTFNEKIPVQIVGAPSAPVQSTTPSVAAPTVSNLRISGGSTLASSFGASVRRTLTFTIVNRGDAVGTPVLTGRWGKGSDLTNVIEMPAQQPLSGGQSRNVSVVFKLGALSVGTYRVTVRLEMVGTAGRSTAATTTSQWPIALIVCLLVLLVLTILLVVILVRRRAARRDVERPEGGPRPTPGGAGAETVTPPRGVPAAQQGS